LLIDARAATPDALLSDASLICIRLPTGARLRLHRLLADACLMAGPRLIPRTGLHRARLPGTGLGHPGSAIITGAACGPVRTASSPDHHRLGEVVSDPLAVPRTEHDDQSE